MITPFILKSNIRDGIVLDESLLFHNFTGVVSKTKSLVFIAGLILLTTFVQAQDLQWISTLDRVDNSSGTGIAFNNQHHIFSTGNYYDTLVMGQDTLLSRGNQDIFLARHDTLGNVVWVKTMGSNLLDESTALVVDDNGIVIITGGVNDSIYIQDSVYTSGGLNQTLFIARFDSLGNFLDINFLDNILYCLAMDMKVDADNGLVLTGWFSGTFTKDSVSFENLAGRTFFIVKVNSSGTFIWGRMATGNNNIGASIAIGMDAYFVTGSYEDGAVFDSVVLSASGLNHNMFVARYEREGILSWINTVKGPGEAHGKAISVNNNGRIVVSGEFFTTLDSIGYTTYGSFDFVLLGYDLQGNMLWSRQQGGINKDWPAALASDGTDFFLTGIFSDTTDFNDTMVVAGGVNAASLQKLDEDGKLLWLRQLRSSVATVESVDMVWKDSMLLLTGKFYQNIIGDNGAIPFDTLYTNFNKKYYCALFADTSDNYPTNVRDLDKQKMIIFPNPTLNGILYLRVPKEFQDVRVFVWDALGRKVQVTVYENSGPYQFSVVFDKVNQGIYFISVETRGSIYITEKVIVN